MIHAYAYPALVAMQIVHAVGDGLPLRGNQEVMNPNYLRISLGTPLPACILEVADQLLLLCVHGDHRLLSALKASHQIDDVAELRVPILVLRSFTPLLVGLQAVAQTMQQLCYYRMADRVSHGAQRRGQIADAFQRPPQRRIRISGRRWLHQRVQIREQLGILLGRWLATTTRPARTVRLQVRTALEFAQTALNGRARDPGRALYQGDATVPKRLRLCGGPQPPRPLIQRRRQCFEFRAQRFLDVHGTPSYYAAIYKSISYFLTHP